MVGDSDIVSSNSARNLGVIFDKCIKLDCHIICVCKSTYFHKRNIGGIRNILSNDACNDAWRGSIGEQCNQCDL